MQIFVDTYLLYIIVPKCVYLINPNTTGITLIIGVAKRVLPILPIFVGGKFAPLTFYALSNMTQMVNTSRAINVPRWNG